MAKRSNTLKHRPTYTKLADGTWGIRIPGTNVESGDVVTVYKASGGRSEETVGSIVSTDDGYTIATISRRGSAPVAPASVETCSVCRHAAAHWTVTRDGGTQRMCERDVISLITEFATSSTPAHIGYSATAVSDDGRRVELGR